jgi:hypothetical protein
MEVAARPGAFGTGPRAWAGRLMKPMFEVRTSKLPPLAQVDDPSTARLKQVVFTVTECCHATLVDSRFHALVPRLDAYDEELRGFAYEGAGVGLAALDSWLPWKRRTKAFVAGPGAPYLIAIYLGAGMGLARMRRKPEPFRVGLGDPVLSWIVLDGYGFHEGFFRYRRYVLERRTSPRLEGYAHRAFDHGLGRSIWFSSGANVDAVAATIGGFPESRQADLWSGVGLACGYTGGVDRPTVEKLAGVAGEHRPQLAVGAAVAAKARQQVGNPAAHNEFACEVLCGATSVETAALAEAALQDLPPDNGTPAYETWRQRIRRRYA